MWQRVRIQLLRRMELGFHPANFPSKVLCDFIADAECHSDTDDSQVTYGIYLDSDASSSVDEPEDEAVEDHCNQVGAFCLDSLD